MLPYDFKVVLASSAKMGADCLSRMMSEERMKQQDEEIIVARLKEIKGESDGIPNLLDIKYGSLQIPWKYRDKNEEEDGMIYVDERIYVQRSSRQRLLKEKHSGHSGINYNIQAHYL
uniref:WWE domain-containing protein n=1 Tax=Rhabditophanes sp. KR3021 TaxID=114890 RepID=A0AC35UEY7_9BILA